MPSFPALGVGPDPNAFGAGVDLTMRRDAADQAGQLHQLQMAALTRNLMQQQERDRAMESLVSMEPRPVELAAGYQMPGTPGTMAIQPPGTDEAMAPPETLTPATPPVDVAPVTAQGLTAEDLVKGLGPKGAAAILGSPEGREIAASKGYLTDKDLNARRVLTKANQEMWEYNGRAFEATDAVQHFRALSAMYQRKGILMAGTDPAASERYNQMAIQYSTLAVEAGKDPKERKEVQADFDRIRPFLAAMRKPGGATAENLAGLFDAFSNATSKHMVETYIPQLISTEVSGLVKKIEDAPTAQFFQLWTAEQQRLDREHPGDGNNPKRALLAAAQQMGPEGTQVLFRIAQGGTEFGKLAMKLLGGEHMTKDRLNWIAEQLQVEGIPRTIPGPGGKEASNPAWNARFGEWLVKFKDNPGVQVRADRSGAQRQYGQARGQYKDQRDAIDRDIKRLDDEKKNLPTARVPAQAGESPITARKRRGAEIEAELAKRKEDRAAIIQKMADMKVPGVDYHEDETPQSPSTQPPAKTPPSAGAAAPAAPAPPAPSPTAPKQQAAAPPAGNAMARAVSRRDELRRAGKTDAEIAATLKAEGLIRAK